MKLDTKFYGVIRKSKNGDYVSSDEFVVFLAKDTAFANILPYYLEQCISLGADKEQIESVKKLIDRVDLWRSNHKERLKVPDAHGEDYIDPLSERLILVEKDELDFGKGKE